MLGILAVLGLLLLGATLIMRNVMYSAFGATPPPLVQVESEVTREGELSGVIEARGASEKLIHVKGSCSDAAPDFRSATSSWAFANSTLHPPFTVRVDTPSGDGKYDESKARVVVRLLSDYLISSATEDSLVSQGWQVGSGSKVAYESKPDGSITLDFSDLRPDRPAGPRASALSGKLKQSCSSHVQFG